VGGSARTYKQAHNLDSQFQARSRFLSAVRVGLRIFAAKGCVL
jgi:hypothetical protein